MDPVYYNDNDEYCCAWLLNLVRAGHLPDGDIDCRSIEEVKSDDLKQYHQAHFFAGIGGWPLAFRLAGIPLDRNIWSASLPCQPFSKAGRAGGVLDKRHLWPPFRRLLAERRVSKVTGEQVASMDGRQWLSGIRLDMEALGYRFGAADLCAAGIGAPHIRQRLFWLADSGHDERGGWDTLRETGRGDEEETREDGGARESGTSEAWQRQIHDAPDGSTGRLPPPYTRFTGIRCRDGLTRRIEPGLVSLVDGLPGRVGRLRAYGNSIDPNLAAEFMRIALNLRP